MLKGGNKEKYKHLLPGIVTDSPIPTIITQANTTIATIAQKNERFSILLTKLTEVIDKLQKSLQEIHDQPAHSANNNDYLIPILRFGKGFISLSNKLLVNFTESYRLLSKEITNIQNLYAPLKEERAELTQEEVVLLIKTIEDFKRIKATGNLEALIAKLDKQIQDLEMFLSRFNQRAETLSDLLKSKAHQRPNVTAEEAYDKNQLPSPEGETPRARVEENA